MVTFCSCVPDVIRLLQLGYIAGSPQHPRTGFSIRLIQFQHHLWNNTTISTIGFLEALMSFLDQRCTSRMTPRQLKTSRQRNINRSLRQPFTQAIDIYRRVLIGQQTLFEEGLQLTPHEIFAEQCTRCFGPAEGEEKVSPVEPDFIIAMDGNFQQRHQSHASKDSPEEDQYPPIFIRPSQLETQVTACKTTDSLAGDMKVCISCLSSITELICSSNLLSDCRIHVPILIRPQTTFVIASLGIDVTTQVCLHVLVATM